MARDMEYDEDEYGDDILDPPLHEAVKTWTAAEDVKRLLAAGENPAVRDGQGNTVLQTFCSLGKHELAAEVVPLLIAAGIDPNDGPQGWGPPLYIAANRGAPETARALLEAKADPNGRDSFGVTALSESVKRDNGTSALKLLRLLLDAGGDPNARDGRDGDGNTPLHRATWSAECVKVLLEAGADPNAKGEFGLTPLHKAFSVAVADALVAAGADPEARDDAGRKPADLIRTPAVLEFLSNIGVAGELEGLIPVPDKKLGAKRG
jgi:ankyrin repeat protein